MANIWSAALPTAPTLCRCIGVKCPNCNNRWQQVHSKEMQNSWQPQNNANKQVATKWMLLAAAASPLFAWTMHYMLPLMQSTSTPYAVLNGLHVAQKSLQPQAGRRWIYHHLIAFCPSPSHVHWVLSAPNLCVFHIPVHFAAVGLCSSLSCVLRSLVVNDFVVGCWCSQSCWAWRFPVVLHSVARHSNGTISHYSQSIMLYMQSTVLLANIQAYPYNAFISL